jgi:DNA-binding response OmpR family regulator/HPt (histidine-containing phosphotransfer) domain-containing protein
MKILLVEDDQRLGKLIKDYLMPESEQIDLINNGAEIKNKLATSDYDILILDVMLPKKNGIDICRELRAENIDIAILFITALNNQNDKIKAFESGADDYLTKPFDFQELLLRVKALLRRDKKEELISSLQWDDLVMIPMEKKVYFLNEELTLTPTEFKILQIFLQHPHQVFTTDNIIDKLWDLDNIPTNNTLRSHIKSLRRKFEKVGLGKDFIETVYGMGYKLRESKQKPSISPSTSEEKQSLEQEQQISEQQQELKALIDEIWQEHCDSIYQDCQKLTAYINQKYISVKTDEAIRIAHNLAGFLGTVGFAEGSKIARQIEIILKENRNRLTDEKLTDQKIVDQIYQLINNLTTSLFPEGKPITEGSPTNINIDLAEKVDLLVIDEDENLVSQLNLFIDHPQIDLYFAQSIEFAINYLDEQEFQIIIVETSWQAQPCPENHILELLMAKKRNAQVIVYTKNDSIENRLYCTGYPIFAFLIKSDSLQSLGDIIKNALLSNSPMENLYNVVLIDDDERFIKVLSRKLAIQNLPIKLTTIIDSETFLARIKNIKPDLIILDLKMPKLNGLDICKIIKTDHVLQNIPVIFLTGNLSSDAITQFVEVGADDFISKSKIDLELYPRIMTHLKRLRHN